MKKTLSMLAVLGIFAVTAQSANAFCWSNIWNPAKWGQNCPCEKKCDPCKKVQKCDPCATGYATPCDPCQKKVIQQPCNPCQKHIQQQPCDPCDKLQNMAK